MPLLILFIFWIIIGGLSNGHEIVGTCFHDKRRATDDSIAADVSYVSGIASHEIIVTNVVICNVTHITYLSQ